MRSARGNFAEESRGTARAEVFEEEEEDLIYRCGETTEPLDEKRMQQMIATWIQGHNGILTLTRLQNVCQKKGRTCVPHLHDVSDRIGIGTHKAAKQVIMVSFQNRNRGYHQQ